MENKETGKRAVTNEELMQKIEGLESFSSIIDSIFGF